MLLSDFSYIRNDHKTSSLIDNIEAFYTINEKENTLSHVKAVAKNNTEIANSFGLNTEKCRLAGYMHDISAVMKPQDMLKYASRLGLPIEKSEREYPSLLHQRISKIISENLFGIKDPDILSPIECHTTLKAAPSKYDMALFISDKLSWDRDGRPPFYERLHNSLSVSLEAACLEYINYMLDNDLIAYPHTWFLEAKKYLEVF